MCLHGSVCVCVCVVHERTYVLCVCVRGGSTVLTTSLQGKQGVQGAYAQVRGAANLLEPSLTTSSQS